MMWKVWVPGEPIAQGSMKAFVIQGRAVITHNNGAKLKKWRKAIGKAASVAGVQKVAGPVFLDLTFYFPYRKGDHGTGKNAAKLKPSASVIHSTKPDLDKLVRAVLDGLDGVAYGDDSQVCCINARKKRSVRYHGVAVKIFHAG
jgi:Holliday junction resolvase RusA-like endonuclease